MEKKHSYSRFTEYFSNYIAYRPELKKYFGKISTAILVNQMERWFAHKPTMFYKFMSPCQNPMYREGDSWTEELQFTESEFRSAFDVVGVRHRSKKEVVELLEKGDDPFKGKLYLSYMDVKNNLTYYLRNDRIAEQTFSDILSGFECRQFSPIILSEEQIEKSKEHLQKEREILLNLIHKDNKVRSELSLSPARQNRGAGGEDPLTPAPQNTRAGLKGSSSPIYNNLPELTTKKEPEPNQPFYEILPDSSCENRELDSDTGSGSVQVDSFCNEKKTIPAQAFKKTVSFGDIGSSLTDTQTEELRQRFKLLCEKIAGRISAPTQLLQEIEYALLDKTAMDQCENNFHRKLSCIETLILKGKWRTPAGFRARLDLEEQTEQAVSSRLREIDYEVRLLEAELIGERRLLEIMPDSPENAVTRSDIRRKNEEAIQKIKLLLYEKQQIQQPSKYPPAAEADSVSPGLLKNHLTHTGAVL